MALITSRTLGRRCPVCGAANCTCGGPSNIVAVDERMEVAMSKGKMVRIPLARPGASIQMYEEEARRRGLLPPKTTAETKIRRPTRNKARPAPETEEAPPPQPSPRSTGERG